ncbi:MAG: sulfatase family protein [Candidatus Dormibacteria bacterium]
MHRPNIVFILTDDLTTNLMTPRFMPSLWALSERGATFSSYFVSDSLCCPSRASIFTGRFPHDTGVYTNVGPAGGYATFNARGDQNSTLATDLQARGYRTALMGKYLNRYRTDDPAAPGWDVWDVANWGYPEFNYTLNQNGRRVRYGGPHARGKDNYLTDVLSRLGDSFVSHTAAEHHRQPFFLELATFAPHSPYTPAPRYASLYPGLRYPKTPAFDAANRHPPGWLRGQPPLSASGRREIRVDFRKRAQAAKSIDLMIGSLVRTLRRARELNNTYLVFSSDNGLHMGEHRLRPGKLTAFDTDIHVPLVVVGPGIRAGTHIGAFAENIDLRSTFDALAGTHPSEPVDGRSLTPLLFGSKGRARPPPGWPQGVLVEHRGPDLSDAGPDRPEPFSGNPPSYVALRLASALYVQYAAGGHEYYNLARDPYELDNVYSSLSVRVRRGLRREVARLEGCHDRPACSEVRAPAGLP